MRSWKLWAVLLLAVGAANCGGNGTTPSVIVSPATSTVIVNGTALFTASVTGSQTTSVNWNVCLPPPKSGLQPANCSANNLGKISPVAGTLTAVYTAPATVPSPAVFDVVAFSADNDLYFGAAQVTVTTGIRVQIAPTTATVQELQSLTLTATVTGSTDKTVSWAINNNTTSGGNPQLGTLTPTSNNTAVYTAPGAVPSSGVTISATSEADPTATASATITISAPADPTLNSLSPLVVPEGSAQQDVYVVGSGFATNDTVYAGSGSARAAVTTFFISDTLLRATIPASFFQTSGFLPLQVQRTTSIVSLSQNLTVQPVRPSLIAATPLSTSTNVGALNVNVTGGYYSPSTTQATFNGLNSSNGVLTNYTSSRQLSVTIPQNSLGTAGLYPLLLQNTDVPAGSPAMTSINVSVEPPPQSVPTLPVTTVPVGTTPSAVAIDQALGLALVANTGDGSVSVIDLSTNTVTHTIAGVATKPTGIAVDDMLTPNVAVVVDSAQNTVVAINLSTFTASAPVALPSVTGGTPPISIGLNPVSHRALVAYQLTNVAEILNVGVSGGAPVVTPVQQVGPTAGPVGYSTGENPVVAIDPVLNWAVVAPGGGGGLVNFVDLGSAVNAFYPSGRQAEVVATNTLSNEPSPTGVGINPETHTAILTDPNATSITLFSMLDETLSTVSIANQSGRGYAAAAVSMTSNLGVAINSNSNSAAIIDMSGQTVLQANVSLGNFPVAAAVDPATDEAVVVNQVDGTASILSLGPVRSLHLTEASVNMTLTSATPLQLTLNGSGFVSGTSEVLLDNTAIPAADVTVVSSRQIVATIPASFLASPWRYSVTVENPGGGTNLQSNEMDLAVVQAVKVGQAPVGVAVDGDRDIAVVSNYVDGTASLVDLIHGITLAPSPITVGTNPQGVAVLPRTGLAIVADTGSDQVTILDENQSTDMNAPQTIGVCNNSASCSQPVAVGVNGDTGIAAIANFQTGNPIPATPQYYYSTVTMTLDSPATALGVAVDQGPDAVAFDPNLNYLAVATTIGTSAQPAFLDVIDFSGSGLAGRVSNLTRPSGVIFDPLNQVFLVADRGANNVDIVDPSNNTFRTTPVRAGVDPTSLDYNYQTSTLVTVNNSSNSVSLFDYLCPPDAINASCTGPQVRRILALPGSQQFSVGIDQKLNLMVLADQQDDRVLLVPLP
ncbi:MAG TPA: hypothetical protein VMU43_10705 [Candidatus Acidoferrum sp.]|nr:hypothetical protein [Candidatus Acidoferrum sp.]